VCVCVCVCVRACVRLCVYCLFTEYKQQIEKDVMRTFPENPLFRESPAVAMPDDNVAYGLLLRYGI